MMSGRRNKASEESPAAIVGHATEIGGQPFLGHRRTGEKIEYVQILRHPLGVTGEIAARRVERDLRLFEIEFWKPCRRRNA